MVSNKEKTINLVGKLYDDNILEYNIWAKIHNSIIDIKEQNEED